MMRGRHELRYPWGDSPLAAEDVLTAPDVAELLGQKQSTVEEHGADVRLGQVELVEHRHPFGAVEVEHEDAA